MKRFGRMCFGGRLILPQKKIRLTRYSSIVHNCIMETKELYRAVTELYLESGSVKETAEILHISIVKARRILITEGLWESKTSKEIGDLYRKGYSCEEIAERLYVSVKNVQAYIPYSRGSYGESETSDSLKSSIYRAKKESLAQSSVLPRTDKEDAGALELKNFIKAKPVTNAEDSSQTEIGKALPFKPAADEILQLKLELVHKSYDADYEHICELDKKFYDEFLKYARAKEGISRTILVPGNMSLHSLHYLIQRAFGFLNGHLHSFALPESYFNEYLQGMYSDWKYYQGALFTVPQEEDPADRWFDDDYDGDYSFNKWLKSKYYRPSDNYCASETYLYQKKEEKVFDRFIAELFGVSRKSLKKIRLEDINRKAIIMGDFNCLLERLTLSEIFVPCNGKANAAVFKSQMKSSIERADENIKALSPDEIKELHYYIKKYINIYEDLINITDGTYEYINKKHPLYGIVKEYQGRIDFLKELIWPAVNSTNPRLEPFTDKLLYSFDFGDGWTILITCDKVTPGVLDAPKCIEADGLNLLQDSGGIYGYIDILKQIKGCDGPKEQESAYNWARYMGYTGRKSNPENIL